MSARPGKQRLSASTCAAGAPAHRTRILTFDQTGAILNGACTLTPRTILIADSLGGLIRRVDLTDDGLAAAARVWLRHETMALNPDSAFKSVMGPQPGINGIHYAGRTNFVYYTSSAQKVFMRVPIDPVSHEPVGQPEIVTGGFVADDFCIDENARVAYLTTHVDNTLLRVPLDSAAETAAPSVVAGDPFTEQVVGPSSTAWARGPSDYGHVAYVTTDGGYTAAEYHRPGTDGIVRPAQVLRVELGADSSASR
jgi:hypothetical protein